MSERTLEHTTTLSRMQQLIRRYPDAVAVLFLVALWLLFFWRLFTPIAGDQVSIVEGDFNRQFVTFGAYQFDRLTAGEIPLWNPYNNGGLPFIADTQAAVFYPPRLLTILVTDLISGEWTYNALQIEMAAHVLLFTLLTYALLRRLTLGRLGTHFAGLATAIITGYSGFITGYPPLQLALLEAAIWLPLALIGIVEATRTDQPGWQWLAVAGLGLGISWMAGHPQTSWFATYALVAYLGWRCYTQGYGLWRFVVGTVLVGVITAGISAVQLIPSAEYLGHTMRQGLSFDEKSGGFPPQDVMQFIIPGVVSLFSPLYIGITGLTLAGVALVGQHRDRFFFAVLALLALIFSLGGNSSLFHATYTLMPGAEAFRGQERAAYLVMMSLAILAGLGVVTLTGSLNAERAQLTRRALIGFTLAVIALAGGIFVAWLGDRAAYANTISPAVFSAGIAGAVVFLYPAIIRQDQPRWRVLLVILIAFELTSVTIDSDAVFESVPASERTFLQAPPLVQRAFTDAADDTQPYRVEGGQVRGEIGIYSGGNTGTLYQIADIRGISPLFLDGPHAIIQREMPAEIAWELFAVRYVFTDAEELTVPSELFARDYPDGQTLNLHRLENPRPFALLLTDHFITADDATARDILRREDFDPRNIAIIAHEPDLELPNTRLDQTQAAATVTDYAPESFTVAVDTPMNALLSLAQVDYPGWTYTINGEAIEPIRAYGGLVALPIPEGTHTVEARYQPLSFTLGAVLSLVTWVGLVILGAMTFVGVRHAQ